MGAKEGDTGATCGFYNSRVGLDVGGFGEEIEYDVEQYPNVSGLIGSVISTGKATLHELNTIYGIEDCYDLIEIAVIDARNAKAARNVQRP